jgi:ribosome-associated translation inhibitor RaiA
VKVRWISKEDLFCKERAESFARSFDSVTADLKKQIIKHKAETKRPIKKQDRNFRLRIIFRINLMARISGIKKRPHSNHRCEV